MVECWIFKKCVFANKALARIIYWFYLVRTKTSNQDGFSWNFSFNKLRAVLIYLFHIEKAENLEPSLSFLAILLMEFINNHHDKSGCVSTYSSFLFFHSSVNFPQRLLENPIDIFMKNQLLIHWSLSVNDWFPKYLFIGIRISAKYVLFHLLPGIKYNKKRWQSRI